MAKSPEGPRPAAEQDATSPAPSPAKPVARFGNETVSAAVFQEQRTTKSGESFTAFNISLRRSYRKEDQSYGHTHTLRASDLEAAIKALEECREYIASTTAAEKA